MGTRSDKRWTTKRTKPPKPRDEVAADHHALMAAAFGRGMERRVRPAATSWWTAAPREGFQDVARAEVPRMALSALYHRQPVE